MNFCFLKKFDRIMNGSCNFSGSVLWSLLDIKASFQKSLNNIFYIFQDQFINTITDKILDKLKRIIKYGTVIKGKLIFQDIDNER